MCLALGHRCLAETESLSSAEFAFWQDFYARYGFPVDRLEGVAAQAGSAVCAAQGVKVDPRELVLRSNRRSAASLVAAFSGIPGAKVERRPRKGDGS